MLQKIDELKEIAKISNAVVTDITNSKLDNLINNSEVFILGYCVSRRDRKKTGGGVVCYIIVNICYNTKETVIQMRYKTFSSNFFFQKQNQ